MSRDEPSAQETTRGTPMRNILIVGILAFLAGVAAMATLLRFYESREPDAGPPPPVAERVVREQPETAAGEPADTASLPALTAREQALSERLNALEDELDAVEVDARLAASFATRAEGLLVAFAARRALDRGLPLGYIQGQLRERFGDVTPDAVQIVIRAAREPVTLEDLRLALDAITPRLMASGPEESWWDGMRRELGNLVVIREETTPSPRPTDRLTRAQRMLDAGNVEAAIGEVARLPGADNAPSWIAAAKRYVEARRALNTLEIVAIQGRAAAGPGSVRPPRRLSEGT